MSAQTQITSAQEVISAPFPNHEAPVAQTPVLIVNHLSYAVRVYGADSGLVSVLPAANQVATVETQFDQMDGLWHIVSPEVWLANMHLFNLIIAGEQAFNHSPFSSVCPVI